VIPPPSTPRVSPYHLFDLGTGPHVLVVDHSRVYQLGDEAARALAEAAAGGDDAAATSALTRLGLSAPAYIDDRVPEPPLRSLSLAIAQKCNLGCTYCYAEQGSFGEAPQLMTQDVANAAVDLLLRSAAPGERVNLIFLGGEPLVNRAGLRAVTERAAELARDAGIVLGFAITTNGTLVDDDDAAFFERYGFSVTVSIDGVGAAHDALRPFKSGRPSYGAVMANAARLVSCAQRMQVSARVTVTPRNLDLPRTLDELVRAGFHGVGFSPMLSSPTGADQLGATALERMLEQMIACAAQFEDRTLAGDHYPFSNALQALREIHRGTARPYPCGAGAGYFGVAADGKLHACHRFVGDQPVLGEIGTGVDRARQADWLAARHVHQQEPCRTCWARYLCGGGCHHEVLRRGRPACDYIRGWLHHCLGMYARLIDRRPGWFAQLSGAA
jgi:uncharacterized protein